MEKYDYVVKLDADLLFDETYFERLFMVFQEDETLGIAGGLCNSPSKHGLEPEKGPVFHVRGPTKVYRSKCFQAIGGISPNIAYDTIDEVKANQLGWTTRTLEHISLVHLRKTGASAGTAIRWRVSQGRGARYCGYHPMFFLLRCFRLAFAYPFLLGMLAGLYGYIGDSLRGVPRIDDPGFIRYLREQQVGRLLLRETIWK